MYSDIERRMGLLTALEQCIHACDYMQDSTMACMLVFDICRTQQWHTLVKVTKWQITGGKAIRQSKQKSSGEKVCIEKPRLSIHVHVRYTY